MNIKMNIKMNSTFNLFSPLYPLGRFEVREILMT